MNEHQSDDMIPEPTDTDNEEEEITQEYQPEPGRKPPNRLPIKIAKTIAHAYGQRQVIIITWDGQKEHCVTYGQSEEDCASAAAGGNRIKSALGWPESLQAEPRRVQKLKDRIWRLEAEVAQLQLIVTNGPQKG